MKIITKSSTSVNFGVCGSEPEKNTSFSKISVQKLVL